MLENIIITPQNLLVFTIGLISAFLLFTIFASKSLFDVSPNKAELFFVYKRLLDYIRLKLKISKKGRPWGKVYNSDTKESLDPVYVSLVSETGFVSETTLTDARGNFRFKIIVPGNYTLVARKNGYVFPSQTMVGKSEDEVFSNLYYGEYFSIKNQDDIVVRNIPMDPRKTKSSSTNLNNFLGEISAVFIIFLTFTYFASPSNFLLIILLILLLLCLLIFMVSQKKHGVVIDKVTRRKVPFSILRIYSERGTELLHKVSNYHGKYYCPIENGSYSVSIDKKTQTGYQRVIEKKPVEISDGYLAVKFEI